ncbi:MAG: division/cell wall cluster transcriptional repressor MraZ [Lachnospiraceae bacterium]|jgi:MraZ protein|nr:division/cell wall cluster transcriptional repressor MraZ [Lachnospiraceae bacterium]
MRTNTFMGEFNHTVDVKGRLIIPVKFRESLGDEFVISKGLDGCLFVHGESEWQMFVDKLMELPSLKGDARQFRRYFLAGAETVTIDKQGRILIPEALRHFAGIDKEVVVIGVGTRLEVWSTSSWESVTENIDAEGIAEQMALLGMGL